MEMTEGERKWYKLGVQTGFDALLNKEWDTVEIYTEKGVRSKKGLRQFLKKQENEVRKIVGDALAEIHRRNGWPYARCAKCGYVSNPGSFHTRTSALKCPKCGTTVILTPVH